MDDICSRLFQTKYTWWVNTYVYKLSIIRLFIFHDWHNNIFLSIIVVTLYATLGEDAIAHGINETEVTIVITSHDLLPKFKKILQLTPRVKTLIYMEDQLAETNTSGYKEGVEIISFKSILKRGSEYTVTG